MDTGSTTADPAPGIASAVATIAIVITLVAAAAWVVTGRDWLAGGVLAAWALSTITIAVDVHQLDADLWGPWYIWVVGAAVAYPIIGPLFIYDRYQYPAHPLAGAEPAGTGFERRRDASEK